MNKRVLKVQKAFLREIEKYEEIVKQRDTDIDWERVHMASCGRIGYLMAEKRGVDPELAAIACSVHDYGRIVTGINKSHAEAGYLPIKEFLKGLNMLTNDEIEEVAAAVKNHSSKSVIGSPMEEIVKDADVLDCHQYGLELPRDEQRKRLEAIINGTSYQC